jgi:CO/xanthine dehydrogenase FAD-binding subunit
VRPQFGYHRPTTVAEACQLLAREPEAAILAGGTDLMVHLRQPWRDRRPPAVVNLKRIPELAQVEASDRVIRLGALVSLSALETHPVVGREYPVLPFTARYMGSPAVRNLATLGGNLCNASPAADLSPVLLVLDAQVGIVGSAGERRLALTDFFRGPGLTVLGPGEILSWVKIPRRHAAWRVRYERLDVRRAMDIAIAGAALALRLDPAGLVAEARIALGAVAPTPLRVPAAEAIVVGSRLDGATIARAAATCQTAARPIADVRASTEYRREMVGALVGRGLERVAAGDPLAA